MGPGVCRCNKHTGAVELLPYTSQLWQWWVQRARLNHQDVSEPRPNPQRRPQGGSKPPPRTAHGSEGLRGCPPRGLPRGHLCSVSILNQCSSLTPPPPPTLAGPELDTGSGWMKPIPALRECSVWRRQRQETKQLHTSIIIKQHGDSAQPPALPLWDRMGSLEHSPQYSITTKANVFAVTI